MGRFYFDRVSASELCDRTFQPRGDC